jgi:hypothetical protein
MLVITKLLRQSTLANPATLGLAAKHGAVIGLRWANLVASTAVGIGLAVTLALVVCGFARPSPDELSRLPVLKLCGGLLGFYVTTCGWGAVIGAVTGCLFFSARRRPPA